MPERQKPAPKTVRKAAKDLRKKKTSASTKSEGARILDDQRNDPLPHKPMKKRNKAVRKRKRTAGLSTVRKNVKRGSRGRKRTGRR